MRCLAFFILFLYSTELFAADFASSPQWRTVMHYHRGKSSIDSPNFFLSPEGKTNLSAELEATKALFEGDDNIKKCQFPSRYLLLKKQGLVHKPFPKCDEYEQFKTDLQPAGITLLFTDAYMNNPSSMFGHTLFRIDTKRKGTPLLAHGANYGAFTGENPGMLYAVLGLTGGYFGGFTVKPYYDIINTYNNIENRDIWELNLDFSDDELDFFVAHLWEIGQTQSRYYFFTRNCSYMLMEMLDAVRPSLNLAAQFPIQAIPLDTFKAAYHSGGLVKGLNYRPSRQNKIRHRHKLMSQNQREVYTRIIKTKKFDLPDEMSEAQKADVLETAYQYVQYQYVAKELELGDYRKQSFDALRARSVLKNKGSIEDLTEGRSPLEAHDSMRLIIGGGIRNGENFEEISYRPAYQSLTDVDYGLPKGAEINFLETKWRQYNDRHKFVLQNLDLLAIRSISPIDEMFAPFSFQIKANVERWKNPKTTDENYVGFFEIGTGGSYAFSDWLWGFALVNTQAAYGGALPHDSWIAMSINSGFLFDFERLKLLAEVKPQAAAQKLGFQTAYKLEANYVLMSNLALSAQFLYEDRNGKDDKESMLSLRSYF